MSTTEIVILTVILTIVAEILIIILLAVTDNHKYTKDVMYYNNGEFNVPSEKPILQAGWEEISRDENGKLTSKPIKKEIHFEGLHHIIQNFADNIEEIEDETHEEYIKKLPQYQELVDKSPDKYLKYHLKNSIEKERYELAQYIKSVAQKRGFNLETNNN